jgi:oxygen-independent coproporphyrinogen-3 oxidase
MPAGLYVHVPFCVRKCPYCDFYSVSALDLVPAWLEGLAREAALLAPVFPGPFDTLYLGGGSPSLLPEEELRAVAAALGPLLGGLGGQGGGGSGGPPAFGPLAEATIEANPEDVSDERARSWAALGLGRVSLGVQSYDPRWLHGSLQRGHTPDDNQRAGETVQRAGLGLSLDLIYGHPGQGPDDWAADLDKAAAAGAEHVSAYILTASPGTPLGRAVEAKALRLPPEKALSDLFEVTGQALAMRGFALYEVSNHARAGAACRHNLKYWRRERYLGLGPSAHSFDGERRWSNTASVRRWAASLARGDRPLAMIETLAPEQVRLESIMLGLRLAEGLDRAVVGPSERLADLIGAGYLLEADGRLIPTVKGLLAADALARALA